MLSPKHRVIIAAAGSRKTETIVERALQSDRRVLITTYTNHNLDVIRSRIYHKVGGIPANVSVMSWYQFLLTQWCRPYQRSVLSRPGFIRGLDFQSTRPLKIPKKKPRSYYANKNGDLYRDWVADFAVEANKQSAGAVKSRLEAIYDEIYIDEVQDLVAYDLDVLDVLLSSSIELTMVGDPRQHTYETNNNVKYPKYRGEGIVAWLKERSSVCEYETRTTSYRCNQKICDFADALYPHLDRTISGHSEAPQPNGILMLTEDEACDHIEAIAPAVLRWDAKAKTLGFSAKNFGAVKGDTYDHVVIFPTGPMKTYLNDRDPTKLKPGARSKLYVGITRARHSVAFVI